MVSRDRDFGRGIRELFDRTWCQSDGCDGTMLHLDRHKGDAVIECGQCGRILVRL